VDTIECNLSNGNFSCSINVAGELVNQLSVKQWMQLNGDQEFLWKQRLTSESTVIEVGGFRGNWAGIIAERFNPKLIILEPSTKY